MSALFTIVRSFDKWLRISAAAKVEHRPISNFITAKVVKDIEESYYVDPIGKNIKKLVNYKPDTWRYRISSYRFFYEINDQSKIVFMIRENKAGFGNL